jgi:hypothetical protein
MPNKLKSRGYSAVRPAYTLPRDVGVRPPTPAKSIYGHSFRADLLFHCLGDGRCLASEGEHRQ